MKCIITFVLFLILISCKTTKYIEVEKYKDRIVTNTEIRTDSIHVHDSIIIATKGDTVYKEKYHIKYIDRVRVDSFVRVDSLTRIQHVPVEKELTKWEKFKIDRFVDYSFVFLLTIAILCIYIKYKMKSE